MTHFAAYWKFYDNREEPTLVTGWRIGAKSRLADAARNDILWLFTSGRKCKAKFEKEGRTHDLPEGGVEASLAYLAEVFTIEGMVPERAGDFKLIVYGIEDKCVEIIPPILVDEILRPDGWGKEKPIGALRQGAWRLPSQIADLLKKTLKEEAPETFAKVFGDSQ